ncbi:hypothetical protein PG994_008902 [Apiospora phragmitis]|uniref:Uncharacterized protein n=1 Tax=Apiospora phragmitis TaxID=2905665 RepID=A0ABR1UHR9_9PEZI
MQFNFLLTVTALLASAAVEACKCGSNIDATRACCRSAGGTPTDSDCPAGGISERLSNFASWLPQGRDPGRAQGQGPRASQRHRTALGSRQLRGIENGFLLSPVV